MVCFKKISAAGSNAVVYLDDLAKTDQVLGLLLQQMYSVGIANGKTECQANCSLAIAKLQQQLHEQQSVCDQRNEYWIDTMVVPTYTHARSQAHTVAYIHT